MQLASEEQRLGFADTLRTAAEQAREVLSSEDGAADALGAMAAARRALDGVREHDEQVGAILKKLTRGEKSVTDQIFVAHDGPGALGESQAFVDGQALRTYRHAPNTGSRKSWAAGDATSRRRRAIRPSRNRKNQRKIY